MEWDRVCNRLLDAAVTTTLSCEIQKPSYVHMKATLRLLSLAPNIGVFLQLSQLFVILPLCH